MNSEQVEEFVKQSEPRARVFRRLKPLRKGTKEEHIRAAYEFFRQGKYVDVSNVVVSCIFEDEQEFTKMTVTERVRVLGGLTSFDIHIVGLLTRPKDFQDALDLKVYVHVPTFDAFVNRIEMRSVSSDSNDDGHHYEISTTMYYKFKWYGPLIPFGASITKNGFVQSHGRGLDAMQKYLQDTFA